MPGHIILDICKDIGSELIFQAAFVEATLSSGSFMSRAVFHISKDGSPERGSAAVAGFELKKKDTQENVACRLKFIPGTSITRIKHDNWKCKCGASPHILIHYNAAARGVAARWI